MLTARAPTGYNRPAMEARRIKSALLAVLLLAPALLCAADRGIPALRDSNRRLSAVEGIHCFCHGAQRPGEGSVRAPESPSPRALYFPLAAPVLDAGHPRSLIVVFPPAPPGVLAREPLTPPPIVLA
jgi:hypothetical protein